jgi:hypothetical protein
MPIEEPEAELPVAEQAQQTPAVDTAGVAGAIHALLAGETITDPVDRQYLTGATDFLRSITGAERLADMATHASNLAEVISGYEMQGQDVPPEIDAAYVQLCVLQCQFHINAVTAELQQAAPDKAIMKQSMLLAMEVANVLAKGYKQEAMLIVVRALQAKIDQL